MTTNVRWFHSEMVGVSKLDQTAHTLLDVLNACLIDGFNSVTLDTMTFLNGVVTASIAIGHGFEDQQVINISGATEGEYNGDWIIYDVTLTSFKFDIVGTPTSPATGTPVAKVAPAQGWVQEYADLPNHKIAYKNTDVLGSGYLLRVTDTGGRSATVNIFRVMTDIDTGDEVIYTQTTKYLHKNYSASYPESGRWILAVDKGLIHFFAHHGDGDPNSGTEQFQYSHSMFGDAISHVDGDAHHAMYLFNQGTYNTHVNLFYAWKTARHIDQLTKEPTSYISLSRARPVPTTSHGIASPFSPANGDITFEKMYIYHNSAPVCIRGEIPGALYCSDSLGVGFENKQIVDGTDAFLGKKFLMVKTNNQYSYTPSAFNYSILLAIEIGSDWR